MLAVIAFPVVTLLLAKLFSSDLLGWVFGLTLMAGLAMLPCAAIFYLGLRLGSRGRASTHAAAVNLTVRIERGTVHASDDAPSRRITVPPGTTLRALVALALEDLSNARIAGGKATWIVESSGAGAGAALQPIAVCAQQWTGVRFLIPADGSVAAHFGATLPRLNLRYRGQDDPEDALAALRQLA
ncbi:hypothetical protein [Roseateles sp.]|uniref:hypothetical protein n=1 Tax=Roseateles sp. TaxID=1971397 RepID=UPI003266EC0F